MGSDVRHWVTDNDKDLSGPSILVRIHSRWWPPTRSGVKLFGFILWRWKLEILRKPWRILKVMSIIGFHVTIPTRADGHCKCWVEKVPPHG